MSRRDIYYWKCDRPAAFHGTSGNAPRPEVQEELRMALSQRFPHAPVSLSPAGGQGNHVTFRAVLDGREAFIRVEDGPERDDNLEVESHVLGEVRALGLPAPRVLGVDAARTRVPFAWQALEMIAHPDLNEWHKRGSLDLAAIAPAIGAAVARWQSVMPRGFGPFDPALLRSEHQLAGCHSGYSDYFHLHLDRHLRFLDEHGFLSMDEMDAIVAEIERHRALLALERGCLVHKDLALWNILGSATEIAAFIDWDDAISGDPMDDLSLLGCFHDAQFLESALAGYQSIRPLPGEYRRRFWLHLLRNMIVKAVIRIGAGYFERDDRFFLIDAGGSGESLRRFTHERLALALRGLAADADLSLL